MTETADNYADENSTVAERTGLHVETYINSDIMINLVISYLILSDWIKFKVSTRKFKETHTWWRTLFREDAVEKQISDKIVRNPRTHRIEFPSKLKQFLQSEIHMDQYQLSSQRSSLSPLPTMTSDTTCSWSHHVASKLVDPT